MRPAPLAIVAAVVVAFLAVGGYLILGRGSGGSGVPRTIDATVSGTTMTPDRISVQENDRVTLNVTVDKKEEIHLHGYDIKFEATGAGDTVTHTFTADKTGSFEIEIEDTSTPVGSLQVQPR
jgi:hypothetical protein